ncbi:hypothetical protein R1sor_007236 [Riccia sorocarpa]|uniref:Uncharacterized protein n=1 Tax=Riccia sorocarpa TaxID=122646 RepID=A0ABD3HPU5_9MARC
MEGWLKREIAAVLTNVCRVHTVEGQPRGERSSVMQLKVDLEESECSCVTHLKADLEKSELSCVMQLKADLEVERASIMELKADLEIEGDFEALRTNLKFCLQTIVKFHLDCLEIEFEIRPQLLLHAINTFNANVVLVLGQEKRYSMLEVLLLAGEAV